MIPAEPTPKSLWPSTTSGIISKPSCNAIYNSPRKCISPPCLNLETQSVDFRTFIKRKPSRAKEYCNIGYWTFDDRSLVLQYFSWYIYFGLLPALKSRTSQNLSPRHHKFIITLWILVSKCCTSRVFLSVDLTSLIRKQVRTDFWHSNRWKTTDYPYLFRMYYRTIAEPV